MTVTRYDTLLTKISVFIWQSISQHTPRGVTVTNVFDLYRSLTFHARFDTKNNAGFIITFKMVFSTFCSTRQRGAFVLQRYATMKTSFP